MNASAPHTPPPAELLIFARQPRAGRVKTRLARSIGAEGALAAYEAMLECVLARWRSFEPHLRCVLAVTPDAWAEAARTRWDGLEVLAQGPGDLGQRLTRVTQQRWDAAGCPMILLGADSPDLPAGIVRDAARSAANGQAALCPSDDGGYCLLAIPRLLPALFDQIDWGSQRVADQTREAARRAGVTLVELPAFCDVDTLDDLRALWQRTRTSADVHLRRLAERIEAVLRDHAPPAGQPFSESPADSNP